MRHRAGRVLVFATTVVLVTAALPAGIAAAKTIVKATPGHGTLATAETVPLAPDLVISQVLPNGTQATAQPVSPTYYATDVTGAVSKTLPSVYFGFNLPAGYDLHLVVEAGKPVTEFPELALYDPDENLVAIANSNTPDRSGSIIDYTTTGAGKWTAEITSNASQLKAKYFRFDLRITPVPYTTDVHGYFATTPGYYAISTHAGDNLHLVLESATPATKFTELFLYDSGGELVAIVPQNAPDRSGSVIDFTTTATGNWYAEATGAPKLPKSVSTHFKYDLTIAGDTGAGPVKPK